MKNNIIVIFYFLFAGYFQNICAWDSTAAKFFPVAIGNTWSYHYTTYGPTNCFTILSQSDYIITIIGFTLMPNSKWYFRFNDDTYYRIDSSNMNVYKYGFSGNECRMDSLLARKNDTVYSCAYLWIPLIVTDTSASLFWSVIRRTKQMAHSLYSFRRHLAEGIGFYHDELCYSTGRYRRDLNGCIINGIQYGNIIGVAKISNEIPLSFSLLQNYPNPFNPVTKIRFNVPSLTRRGAGVVVLKVYDVLGREVQTLVNETLQPGTYEVDWPAPTRDGGNFSSGVYYYTLSAGDYIQTKKMVLLR